MSKGKRDIMQKPFFYRQTDKQTDSHGETSNEYTRPHNFVGRGFGLGIIIWMNIKYFSNVPRIVWLSPVTSKKDNAE